MKRYAFGALLSIAVALSPAFANQDKKTTKSPGRVTIAGMSIVDAAKLYDARDYNGAAELFALLASEGDIAAQSMLGYIHEVGEGVDVNYEVALQWYLTAAKGGSVTALERLGWMHQKGMGVSRDYDAAILWYKKAIEKGNVPALRHLGWMYQEGLGVEADPEKALELYLKGAGFKDTQAMYMATELLDKRSDESSQRLLFQLLDAAAEDGHPLAQRSLAMRYEEGRGIERDYEKARNLYQMSADNGDNIAQYRLGRMHENGYGVDASAEQAFVWYSLSASQGNVLAQWSLGRLYAEGKGAPYSLPRAYMWLDIAADSGGEEFMELRDTVARHMTSRELEEAKKMTATCRQHHFLVCG